MLGVGALLFFPAARLADAAVTLTEIALLHEQIPDLEQGATLDRVFGWPSINEKGDIAFEARDTSTAYLRAGYYRRYGLWISRPGSDLTLVVHEGAQAAGLEGGLYYGSFYGWQLGAAGEIVFWGAVEGPGVVLNQNATAIWRADPSGAVSLLARSGDPAAGAPGLIYGRFDYPPQVFIDERGEISFFALLLNPDGTFARWGFLLPDASGYPSLQIAMGDPAPGLPDGVVYESISHDYDIDCSFDDAGVAFRAGLAGPGVDGNNRLALFGPDATGGVSLIARAEDPAPVGDDIAWDTPSNPTLRGGNVAFLAALEGTEDPASDGIGAFVWDGTTLALRSRWGDAVPGGPPDLTYKLTYFGSFYESRLAVDDAGDIAFAARVAGPGVTPETQDAVFGPDEAGGLAMLLRTGDHAPGLPSGYVLSRVGSSPFLSHQGAVLTSLGFTTDDPGDPIRDALYYIEPGGRPIPLLRVGRVLPEGTIAGYTHGPSAHNDHGEAAVILSFEGGPVGVYLATAVPEPDAGLFALTAVTVALALRRRNALQSS